MEKIIQKFYVPIREILVLSYSYLKNDTGLRC